MAYFDRFDICAAHQAIENDWNVGGWLQQRASNLRRMEATHVQLDRIGYRPARDYGCAWEYLGNDNERGIYVCNLIACGLAKLLSPHDEAHAAIVEYIVGEYTGDYIARHFPQLHRV